MLSIYRREMRSYFTTPIGYIFMGIFMAFSGFLFSVTTVLVGSSDPSSYFVITLFLFIILIPLLTMKLFSEERKLKTEQILLTSPVSISGIVFGKFLAAFSLFSGTFIISSFCNFIALLSVAPDAAVNYPKVIGNIFGILLIGGAFISIGICLSSLTENQLIAAISTIGAIISILLLSFVPSIIDNAAVRVAIKWISFLDRFYDFTKGIFSIPAILYYISVTTIFIFLTTRIFEKRRWG